VSEHIVIIGAGRMGLALGAALHRSGEVERLMYLGRSLEPPPHPLFEPDVRTGGQPAAEYRTGILPLPPETTVLLLAVPDAALAEVTYDVVAAGTAPPGCAALHLSGALSTDVLEPLHRAGYAIGSIHPLQTVADPWRSADRLFGVSFAVTGDPAGSRAAHRLVHALDGRPLVIPPNLRPVYHAAAVMASNHVVALVAAAARLLEQAGVPSDEAAPALMPLVAGTIENMQQLGIPAALTGPIARGDSDTVRLHLARLSAVDRSLYSALSREVLRLARSAGVDPRKADEIEELLGPG
jgi:predicted short-subunit dehydrogenase-like oxidoreductase (DUF2520 family)